MFAAQLSVNDDTTYNFFKVSITTVLEPVLGMIVSSLPMFPSAFKNFLGGEGDRESLRVRSSNFTRLRSNGTEPSRHLPRLGNSYPLADLNMSILENEAIESNSGASPFDIEHSMDP